MSTTGVLFQIDISDDFTEKFGITLPSTNEVTSAANTIVVRNLRLGNSTVKNTDNTVTVISGGHRLEFTAVKGGTKWNSLSVSKPDPTSGIASAPPPGQ